MQFAKWFRPILGLGLTGVLLIVMVAAERYHLISYFKTLYEAEGVP